MINLITNIKCTKHFSSLTNGKTDTKKYQLKADENVPQTDLLKVYHLDKTSKKSYISFQGEPWKINLCELKISDQSSITAKEAIEIFEKFKLGNYLDIDGGSSNYGYKYIKQQNLAFLDRINSPCEKKVFIDYYNSLTKFPNMYLVSERIKEEFVNSIRKTEEILKKDNPYNLHAYEVLYMGYDGVSSIAKRKALPGSDLDKAFIVLRGNLSNPEDDKKVVENFKWRLWENTDQRILSYNHDIASFPQVYTLSQIEAMITAINNKTILLGLHKKADSTKAFSNEAQKTTTLFEKYHALMQKYSKDYIEANGFFIRLCNEFPVKNNWDFDFKNPSRENIYSFGFFYEAFIKGHHFSYAKLPNEYKNSDAAKLINLSQIHALKDTNGFKRKYVLRERLQEDFYSWSIEKQFDFIKEMIKASCGDNTGFPEYFNSNEANRFSSLMCNIGLKGNI